MSKIFVCNSQWLNQNIAGISVAPNNGIFIKPQQKIFRKNNRKFFKRSLSFRGEV